MASSVGANKMFGMNPNQESVRYEFPSGPTTEGVDGIVLKPPAQGVDVKALRGAGGRAGNGPETVDVERYTGRGRKEFVVFWVKRSDFDGQPDPLETFEGATITDRQDQPESSRRTYRVHKVEYDQFSEVYEFLTFRKE